MYIVTRIFLLTIFSFCTFFELVFAQTTHPDCPTFNRRLAYTSIGWDVFNLQRYLVVTGYMRGYIPNGYYGLNTVAAVKKWQVDHGIALQTGVVGGLTGKAMAECRNLFENHSGTGNVVTSAKISSSSISNTVRVGVVGTYGSAPLITGGSTYVSGQSPSSGGAVAYTGCSFNGTLISHGGTILQYATTTVPYGSICQSEVRTCTNGVLSGSYTNASCTVSSSVATTSSCVFNNQSMITGATVTAYQSSTAQSGSACVSEVRSCNNGLLSGSFTNASCSVSTPLSCHINGQTVASGSTTLLYQAATVPYGSTCQSEVRTCTNGVLSGSYTNASCVVGSAPSGDRYSWAEKSVVSYDSVNWTSVAMSGDGNTLAQTHFSNPDTVFISRNAGATWIQANIPTTRSVRSFSSVDISGNGEVIVVADKGGYIHLSRDGGSTWVEKTEIGSYNWKKVSVSENGQKIAALSIVDSRVVVSTDGGTTWDQIHNSSFYGFNNLNDIYFSPDGQKLILAAYSGSVSGAHLFISADNGSTWVSRLVQPQNLGSIANSNISSVSKVVTNVDGSKIALLADGILPIQNNGRDAVSTNHLIISTDGGSTWTYVSNYWNTGILKDLAMSSNGQRLYTVGTVGNFYSLDGGESWHADPDLWHNSLSYLDMDSAGTKVVTNANGGTEKVFIGTFSQSVLSNITAKLGYVWQQFINPLSFSFLNGNIRWNFTSVSSSFSGSERFLTATRGSFKSVDAGTTWTRVDMASSSNSKIINSRSSAMSNDGSIILVGNDPDASHGSDTTTAFGGFTLVSRDHGATWNPVLRDGFDDMWTKVGVSSNGQKMFVAKVQTYSQTADYMYVSNDSGMNWTRIDTNTGPKVWDTAVIADNGTIFVKGLTDNYSWISYDMGASWNFIGLQHPSAQVAMSSDGKYLVYVVLNSSSYYISSDYGHDWTQGTFTEKNLPEYGGWRSISISDNGQVIAVAGPERYIYVSHDGGNSWLKQESAGLRQWSSVKVSKDGRTITAGTSDGYVYGTVISPQSLPVVELTLSTTTPLVGGTYSVSWNSTGADVCFLNSTQSSLVGSTTYTASSSPVAHVFVCSNLIGSATSTATVTPYVSVQSSVSSTTKYIWTEKKVAGHDTIWVTMDASSDLSTIIGTNNNFNLFLSRDGGNTFVSPNIQTSSGNQGQFLYTAVSGDGQTMIAIDSNGYVNISTDGGALWRELQNLGAGNKFFYTKISDDGKSILISTSGDLQDPVYSNDKGLTWSSVPRINNSITSWYNGQFSLSPDGKKMYASGVSGNTSATMYSTDAGASWDQISLVPSNIPAAMAYPGDVNYGISQCSTGSVVLNCPSKSTTSITYFEPSRYLTWGYVNSFNAITTSFLGNRIFAAAQTGGYYSLDSGATWKKDPDLWMNIRQLKMSSDGTKVVGAGDGGYLYFGSLMNSGSSNLHQKTGLYWENVVNPFAAGASIFFKKVASSFDGLIQIATSYTHMFRTQNKGLDWYRVVTRDNDYSNAIDISSDGSTVVVGAQEDVSHNGNQYGGKLSISHDAGISWNSVLIDSVDDRWVDVSVNSNGNKLVAVGEVPGTQYNNWVSSGKYMYISNDGGSTWGAVPAAGSRQWKSVDVSGDGQIIVASGLDLNDFANPANVISRDGGATWGILNVNDTGIQTGDISISSDGVRVAYVKQTPPNNVFVSHDGGVTWHARVGDTDNPSAGPNTISVSDDGGKMISCTLAGYVILSQDGGNTWTRQYTGGTDSCYDALVTKDGKKVTVVTTDGNIYTADVK